MSTGTHIQKVLKIFKGIFIKWLWEPWDFFQKNFKKYFKKKYE